MKEAFKDIKIERPEIGQKIYAIIKHYKDKFPGQGQNLIQAEDGFYVDDGPEELSHNWSVIAWKERVIAPIN